jgi:uncharacterized protein
MLHRMLPGHPDHPDTLRCHSIKDTARPAFGSVSGHLYRGPYIGKNRPAGGDPLDDGKGSCPFVREDGCILYEDRPTACRYYPLGVASLQHKEGADDEGFFFFVNEPHCKGFDEKCQWTVADWRKDQGVDLRDEVNAAWTDLVVHKKSFPPNIKLTPKAKEMFFMVSYNIDEFRRFIFDSTFLQRMPVDEKAREELKTDDVALLKFGVQWLKSILFKPKNPVTGQDITLPEETE